MSRIPSILRLVLVAGVLGLTPALPALGQGDGADDTQTLELTFDDLAFDMEKDEIFERDMLTDEINDLKGKRISLRGYILPASVKKSTGITGFVFVRDNQECCFGPGAALYDCVLVKLKKDHTTEFTVRPVEVEPGCRRMRTHF